VFVYWPRRDSDRGSFLDFAELCTRSTPGRCLEKRQLSGLLFRARASWSSAETRHARRGGSRGTIGAIAPLKFTKVTLFTMILYNWEDSIRDMRPFCRPLFCHSSVVMHTSSLLQPWTRNETPLTFSPLTFLAGSDPDPFAAFEPLPCLSSKPAESE